MLNLPGNIIELIYSFDSTYRDINNKSLKQLKKKYIREFINRERYNKCYICDCNIINLNEHFKTFKHRFNYIFYNLKVKSSYDDAYETIIDLTKYYNIQLNGKQDLENIFFKLRSNDHMINHYLTINPFILQKYILYIERLRLSNKKIYNIYKKNKDLNIFYNGMYKYYYYKYSKENIFLNIRKPYYEELKLYIMKNKNIM